MRIKDKCRFCGALVGVFSLCVSMLIAPRVEAAGYTFAVSPMDQKIVINPGESYTSSFTVANTASSEISIRYFVELSNFYSTDEDSYQYDKEIGETGEILKWITFDSPTTGVLSPNESVKVQFTVDVPSDAVGGGQYAAFMVSVGDVNTSSNDSNSDGYTLSEKKKIAHLLYAEITGDIVREGEVVSIDVPGFLLSGNIKGTSAIKNTGNVHESAKYTLQIFPIFSDEEVYTNEENPSTRNIMPDRTLYQEIEWAGTPQIGIFNVIYTVEFGKLKAQTSRIVIVCPLWLLFIVLFVVALIAIWLTMQIKRRRKVQK